MKDEQCSYKINSRIIESTECVLFTCAKINHGYGISLLSIDLPVVNVSLVKIPDPDPDIKNIKILKH